jgi:Uma2 family endonuclease
MQEYIENGSQLGLLLDQQSRTVSIYRPNQDPELPGFVLQMAKVW